MQVGKLIAVWLPIALGIVMIGAGAVNFVGPGSVRELLRVIGGAPSWRFRHVVERALSGLRRLAIRMSGSARSRPLQLHALLYNLGNFLRTLATLEPIKDWSLTTLKEERSRSARRSRSRPKAAKSGNGLRLPSPG